jgi:beta-lactamase superfamily II metal-dependent hydrolase
MKYLKIGFITIGLLICFQSAAHAGPGVRYTMLNVSSHNLVGDAHLIQFADGQVYVIDTGNEGVSGGGKLVSYLKEAKIEKIDKLFISHAHRDHYGGLIDLMNSSIIIYEIYFNLPDRAACDQERPWGCDYDHIMKVRGLIQGRRLKMTAMRTGDIYQPTEDVKLQVLFVQKGWHPNIGKTDINDTSAVMKLIHGNQSVLFTGDLNWKAGDYLAGRTFELKADIFKVPHHGTESAASNYFFKAVKSKVAMVPSSAPVWLGDRSRRIREYFHSNKIPVYISGLNGDVSISILKDSYRVYADK